MSDAVMKLADRAGGLRHAFDQGFAAPPPAPAADTVDLLAIRVAGQPYALRLAEIAGLFADKRITTLPAEEPALLGLAGFRGAILPVWGLHLLLGHGAGPARWLVVAAAAAVALGFEAFEGHLRLPLGAILPPSGEAPAQRLAPERAQTPEGLRPVVHLAAILGAIGAAAPATKEH